MKQYLDYLRNIRENGDAKTDRTGTGTVSLFGQQMRFNLADGFPLVTTKKTHLKSIIHELLWFLKGETNIRYLKENGVSIWDEWVDKATAEYIDLTIDELKLAITNAEQALVDGQWKDVTFTDHSNIRGVVCGWWAVESAGLGSTREVHYDGIAGLQSLYKSLTNQEPRKLVAGELGPVYGDQWINWDDIRVLRAEEPIPEGFDDMGFEDTCGEGAKVVCRRINQIQQVIDQLKNTPDSRRIIVSAWNVAKIQDMKLPPCHAFFQFYTAPLSWGERWDIAKSQGKVHDHWLDLEPINSGIAMDEAGIPKFRLSCQLYQRKHNCALAA